MFFFLYIGQKKEEKAPCLGLSPLRYYKDNTFSREMQVALTFRNTLRNVKRRVLHTRGFAMYYITRAEVGAPLRPSCRLPCAHRFNGCENNFVSVPNGMLRLLAGNAGSGCRSAKANRPAAGRRHSKDATSHRLPQLRIFHKIPVVQKTKGKLLSKTKIIPNFAT